MILLVVFCMYLTSPVSIVTEHILTVRLQSPVFLVCVLCLIKVFVFIEAGIMLNQAAVGFATVIGAVFVLLFSEGSPPYVALIILVCYYVWSSYSCFTKKYHDLSLKLFKFYQKALHDQICYGRATTVTTDPGQTESSPRPEEKGNVLKIPKELFDMACEELMPIRDGVCKLVGKVILILIFFWLAFLFITRLHVGVSPTVKALVAFFAGSVPKLVAIGTDGGWRGKLDDMVIDEKAPMIVRDYLNRIQEQGSTLSGANISEMITVDENEETIQIVTA